jgi:hypothetical protein
MPGQPERKTWWRNLPEPRDVKVRLAGEEFHGTAVVVHGTKDPDEMRRGLAVYLRRFPRAAKGHGIPSSSGRAQEINSAEVIVRVDLVKAP